MKQILVFGAGKSATVLIEYFLINAKAEGWHLTVVDADLKTVQEKLGNSKSATALAFDIMDAVKRMEVITVSDIVISLMPPTLHYLIAKDCLKARKNLLTASYVDDKIRSLQTKIEKAGLLFLCEMGLDPGIDHMSAKKLIDSIHAEGGIITSFLSHCGGLVAKESDDNPWHYKISWNPKNVVNAGKAGAVFKQNGDIKELKYEALFSEKRYVKIPDGETLCWYPNRDSLSYLSVYGLTDADTFIRTTLRHPDFIVGWNNLIELKLTSEERKYETDGKSIKHFFLEHTFLNGLPDWLRQKLINLYGSAETKMREVLKFKLINDKKIEKGEDLDEEVMMVTGDGLLQKFETLGLEMNAQSTAFELIHEAEILPALLDYLGFNDDETKINNGKCHAADVLQVMLEKKLMLQPEDKDLVIMIHEIEYTKDANRYKVTSSLQIEGENAKHTAMAKTVGLPLAIATQLILNGKLQLTGLHIPINKEIYEPVLKELEAQGIVFNEINQEIN